jgi:RND family efflux transporter MFP subunit
VGFAGLIAAAAADHLLPRAAVQVVPVIVKRTNTQRLDAPLFQAAGWIEPRPTAISVTALAPGVIEQLLVVEGQRVEQGEPIAHLIRIDAELAVQQAEATSAIRAGELARAEAERDAARIRLENPVHRQVELADARSLLARAKTEYAKLPFLIEAAEANAEFAQSSLQGKLAAESALAGRIVEQARSKQAAALADLRELRQRGPNLEKEIEALQAKVDALAEQLRLLVDETRQLREAEAAVQSATALHDEAKVRLRKAELALERNVVRAPMAGRILELVAAPGARVDASAGHDSGTVVQMYDPARLQVRADVRLEDVPMISGGQAVRIETASSAKVIAGRVLQATSTANVQKNTLEVKVELIDPPETIRPEMLVTATFLAPPTAENSAPESGGRERICIPERLVLDSGGAAAVWVVEADNRARRRELTLGSRIPQGLVEVTKGLKVTDKLITSNLASLRNGTPVTVTGDDQMIGL